MLGRFSVISHNVLFIYLIIGIVINFGVIYKGMYIY